MEIEKTKRIIKVFLIHKEIPKHVKSFPLIYEPVFKAGVITAEDIIKLNKKIKGLTKDDIEILGMPVFLVLGKVFTDKIKKYEPYVYELIAKANIMGVRKIHSKYNGRFEMVFDNEVKLKIDAPLFNSCPIVLPDKYSNY